MTPERDYHQNSAVRDITLRCPICQSSISGTELMRHHLVTEHLLNSQRAKFLTNKLVSWKQGNLNPDILCRILGNLQKRPSEEQYILRKHATAVIIRGGKVLLVKYGGQRYFSLPGGGMKTGESALAAIERELFKVLKLEARNIKRLEYCDFDSVSTRHYVCMVEAQGEPIPRRLEVAKFIWWDMKEDIPIFAHVRKTLNRVLGKPLTLEA